jgi:uncharacterized protein (DUF1697 family)
MGRYVVLLRGINVGGKNIIKMVDLAECLVQAGFTDVTTYIQSGNVLLTAPAMTQPALTQQIERCLAKEFSYDASVVVRSRTQMKGIVAQAPKRFGAQPDKFRYDVLFLRPPLTATAALRDLPQREGVDEAHAGPGVVYASRLIARAAQSKLSKLVALPMYKQMTIRNWNTTTKLLELLGD